MTLPTSQFAARTSRSTMLYLAVLVPCCGLCTPAYAQSSHARKSYAQERSGAASITLTATLCQSLTMSVGHRARPGSVSDAFSDKAPTGNSPLTISTNWVRGPGNVSVQAFSPGNPLLGRVGQAIVPVGAAASPGSEGAAATAGEGFLSSPRTQSNLGLPGLRINTEDLEVPDGSAGQILTIRADAL
jgi:hypothetical protein